MVINPKTLQKKQRKFLKDTIDYYSENVKRRCVTSSICAYSPYTISKEDISEGCAIGRHLKPELKEKFDKLSNSSVKNLEIYNKLPTRLKSLTLDFLVSCQDLHDDCRYWNNKGLSKSGKEIVENICKRYNLNSIITYNDIKSENKGDNKKQQSQRT